MTTLLFSHLAALRAAPAVFPADAAARARAVAKAALSAYQLGQYELAISRYREAYRLLPEPRYLYALGTSHFKLGRLGPALDHLERFLAETRDAASSPLVVRARKQSQEIRRTTSLVSFDVTPAGARILVEGQEPLIAPVKAPLRLRNGQHRLTATLAGHGTLQRQFPVGPGLENRVILRLTPWVARREPPRGGALPPSAGSGVPPVHSAPPRARPLRIAGWTGIALAAASLVAAGALGGLSWRSRKKVEDASRDTMWEPGLADAYSNVRRYGAGAWISFGVGSALVVVGTLLLGLDTRRERERRAQIRLTAGLGDVSLCGTF